jgi:two-component system, response regulator PdtaR
MVILVVEDEAIIGFCLTYVLEDAGHAVSGPAMSSHEALALARENPPDLAFVDIDLENPGSGIYLARQLREQHDCVVIFTTGQMETARAHPECAIGALGKPYDPGDLPALVSYTQALLDGIRVRPPGKVRSFVPFEHHSMRARKRAGLSEARAFELANDGRHLSG